MKNFVRSCAYLFSIILAFIITFKIQFSILVGPLIDALLIALIFILALGFGIANIPVNSHKRFSSYKPLLILVATLGLSFTGYASHLGYYTHFYWNKRTYVKIEKLSKTAGINKLSNMQRHSKSLNKGFDSGPQKHSTKAEIEDAFGDYISEQNLDIDAIVDLRDLLEDSSICHMKRTEDYIVLTIDGLLDT
ncbi:hypothetical protein EYV94_12975 [Puteibacter caeruleilacunae]|nr:hypothetical protein EYV94_12975 [Puteibacter caeruleilacunae]